MPAHGGGMVLHLISKQPVDQTKVKAELPAFLAKLREERQREAFSEWFRKEIEMTRITGLPLSKKSSASGSK